MHDSASRHASNWSITFGNEEEVEWITTSAACSSTSLASAEIFTPQGASVAPVTSPRSRPTFAGSVSMAPMISMACFSRISRAIDAPIGPTPYWMARILFFTSFSVPLCGSRTHSVFASKETPTIMEFPRAFNDEPHLGVRELASAFLPPEAPFEPQAWIATIVAGAQIAAHNGSDEDQPCPEVGKCLRRSSPKRKFQR